MSFIKRNANVSQCNVLKTTFLRQILDKYNQFQLESASVTMQSLDYYIIPNNDLKFYMYTIKKQKLESCKDNYDILYFFPDEHSKEQLSKQQIHKVSDFFVEIDHTFEHSYLFEGYLYKATVGENYTFLITDILAKNNDIISCDFALRQTIINEIIVSKKTFNNHLTIGIHPVFHSESENILQIFLDNFIFSQDIKSIEHAYNKQFEKQRLSKKGQSIPDSKKRIEKGQYADVYNVYDVESGNHQGILYVKGIADSKAIKQLFENKKNACIALDCTYNNHFKKWQVKN
jgi:hypothetical protein